MRDERQYYLERHICTRDRSTYGKMLIRYEWPLDRQRDRERDRETDRDRQRQRQQHIIYVDIQVDRQVDVDRDIHMCI